jgi:hypothetical protein
MTWEEHEKEYCLEIEPRPEDIHDVFDRYCDAENYIYHYECDEYTYPLSMTTVRWNNKYYVVTRLSNESWEYYHID